MRRSSGRREGPALVTAYSLRDRRPPQIRLESDPSDLASADGWLRQLTKELYDAQKWGTMQVVYREGVMAERIFGLGPQLRGRPAFDELQAVFLMADEPRGPGVAELAARAVADHPSVRAEPRFVELLRSTCDYAAKSPEGRAEALFWRSYVIAGTQSEDVEKARALRDLSVAAETGDARIQRQAEGLMFELTRLQVGMLAPEIEAMDEAIDRLIAEIGRDG